MFKRLVVLSLALLISVAVVACTKKVNTEVSPQDPSSYIKEGSVASDYDEGQDLTSSELEKLESEVLTESNIEIIIPNTSSDTDSTNSGNSTSTPNTSKDDSPITGFY